MVNSTAYYNDFWNEMRGVQGLQTAFTTTVRAKRMRTICQKHQIGNIRQHYRKKAWSASWQPL